MGCPGAVRDKVTLAVCCGLGNGREGIKHARRVGEELDFISIYTPPKIGENGLHLPPLWMFLTSSLKCNLNLESDFSRPACFSCILTYTREKTKESDSNVNVEFIKANNWRSFWTITIFICLSNHKKQTFMFYLS